MEASLTLSSVHAAQRGAFGWDAQEVATHGQPRWGSSVPSWTHQCRVLRLLLGSSMSLHSPLRGRDVTSKLLSAGILLTC